MVAEILDFLTMCMEVAGETLETLMSLDLFTYIIGIAIAIVTIYFIVDLMHMHERELLTLYTLTVGFVKLFIVYVLVAFSTDIVLAATQVGYGLFDYFKGFLEDESRTYLVIQGVWGTDLPRIAELISPGVTAGLSSAIRTGIDTIADDSTIHFGCWIFSPDYKYDCLYTSYMPFKRSIYSTTSSDVFDYRFAIADIKNSLGIVSNSDVNCIWQACPYHGGTQGHAIEDFLADKGVFGNSVDDYIAHLYVILIAPLFSIGISIIKIICLFLTAKIAFDFLLYSLMFPIGIAHLLEEGQRSKGVIYFKKFMSKMINFALMLLSLYIFNKIHAQMADALFFGTSPIFDTSGGNYNGFIPKKTTGGRNYILLQIADKNLNANTSFSRLDDLMSIEMIIYTLIPLIGLLATLTSVNKISQEIVNTNN